MRLFRSEEHVERWQRQTGYTEGETFPVSALWTLAQLWFRDRLSPDWRRPTKDEAHAVFARARLGGRFWKLDG